MNIRNLKIFGALAVLTLGGCAILGYFGLESTPRRDFSHKVHVTDQSMECRACHKPIDARVGMPEHKQCLKCHEAGSPVEERIRAAYGEPPLWSTFTVLPDEVTFSHATHADRKVACAECHVGIETNTVATEGDRVSMDACTACHAKRGKAADRCETCHQIIRKDWAPGNHELNWKYEHGPVVRRGEVPPYRNRCSLCHSESTCTKCHQDEPPRSHTNFWRIQGHAVAVGIDRSSCLTCHRTDFCDRCHRSTRPRSHAASWGAPQERHCLTCHFPLAAQDQNCTLCHEATPSHRLAPPKPGWHNPGMNCRQCHGPGLAEPLPHPDKGDDCNICHF